jgi:uncharacterized protein (TIGR00730 family)
MTRICVFAGSRFGARPAYRSSAEALGRAIVARNLELVYGGARLGLMGVLADAVLAGGGRVTGVIPEDLVAREIAHPGLDDLRIVDSMHARKAVMADLADAFVALPGGWGTFDELFEILTWGQLGLHAKPVGILNIEGYFDPFLSLIAHSTDEGFVLRESARVLIVTDSADALLAQLVSVEAPLAADLSPRPPRA